MSRRTGPLAAEVARHMSRCTRTDDGCLLGPQKSYNIIRYDGGFQIAAHRAVYMVKTGPIPEGLVIRHKCDQPRCVEPEHLLVGTYADNERDKHERNRARVGADAPNAYPDEVVARVRGLYAEGELTKAEVAEATGVPFAVVDKWTKGTVRRLEPLRVRDGRFRDTGQGWARHQARGEKKCAPCVEANRIYMAAWKAQRAQARADADWLGATS